MSDTPYPLRRRIWSPLATSTEAPATCDSRTACLATEFRSDCEVSARDTAWKLNKRIAVAYNEQGLRIG
jgi:hypothetical protein